MITILSRQGLPLCCELLYSGDLSARLNWRPRSKKNFCPVKAARYCQYAVKLSWLSGALALALAANGARMPSTANHVLAKIRSAALRIASMRLCKFRLDSSMVIQEWYYLQMGLFARFATKRIAARAHSVRDSDGFDTANQTKNITYRRPAPCATLALDICPILNFVQYTWTILINGQNTCHR